MSVIREKEKKREYLGGVRRIERRENMCVG